MKKTALVLLAAMFASTSFADVTCSGIPERVYAGKHGPGDSGYQYWVVFPGWQIYLLGDYDDVLAKARFALAMTAHVTGKSLELSFFSQSTCAQAQSVVATPTAAALAP